MRLFTNSRGGLNRLPPLCTEPVAPASPDSSSETLLTAAPERLPSPMHHLQVPQTPVVDKLALANTVARLELVLEYGSNSCLNMLKTVASMPCSATPGCCDDGLLIAGRGVRVRGGVRCGRERADHGVRSALREAWWNGQFRFFAQLCNVCVCVCVGLWEGS